MFLWLINIACAQVILMSVAWRLLLTQRAHPSVACRARWALWTGWHLLVGVGAFAVLTAPLYGPMKPPSTHEILTNIGLAIYFITRLHQRSNDVTPPGVPTR
jgi:hypothetical protein